MTTTATIIDNSTTTAIKATYVWQDVNRKMRSKDRFFYSNDKITTNLDLNNPDTFPTWTYDGSSTGDAYPSSPNITHNDVFDKDDTTTDNYYMNAYADHSEHCITKGYLTECVLRPVKVYTLTTPVRDFDNELDTVCQTHYIVLCSNYRLYQPQPNLDHYVEEPINIDMDKLVTYATSPEVTSIAPQFGFEQEFFLIDQNTNMPYGYIDCSKKSNYKPSCWFLRMLALIIWHLTGFANRYLPTYGHQDSKNYYCSISNASSMQQTILNHISNTLISMGVNVAGTNVEVAPGQCEIQIFGHNIDACHDLMIARYVITHTATIYGLGVSFDNIVIPDRTYNGSGCHTNFSTANTRQPSSTADNTDAVTSPNYLYGMDYIRNLLEYINYYTNTHNNDTLPYVCNNSQFEKTKFEDIFGNGVCERLTGTNETSDWQYFTWSVGERNCSARVPYHVATTGHGYLEDRRPGSNCNPYSVAIYLLNMVSTMTTAKYIHLTNDDSANTMVFKGILTEGSDDTDDDIVTVSINYKDYKIIEQSEQSERRAKLD